MLATTKFVYAMQTEQGLEIEVENIYNGQSKMILNINLPEFMAGFARWKEDGVSIKKAFPQLTAEEHEFLLSGKTAEQQKKLYTPEKATPKMLDLFFGNGEIVSGIGG